MDGRVQLPVIEFLKEKYKVDFVDMITEPGIDKLLAEGERGAIDRIKEKIEISVRKHGSQIVAIIGHTDCAGNPVGEKEHFCHIRKGKEILESMNLGVEILGLWVNKDWKVEIVA